MKFTKDYLSKDQRKVTQEITTYCKINNILKTDTEAMIKHYRNTCIYSEEELNKEYNSKPGLFKTLIGEVFGILINDARIMVDAKHNLRNKKYREGIDKELKKVVIPQIKSRLETLV